MYQIRPTRGDVWTTTLTPDMMFTFKAMTYQRSETWCTHVPENNNEAREPVAQHANTMCSGGACADHCPRKYANKSMNAAVHWARITYRYRKLSKVTLVALRAPYRESPPGELGCMSLSHDALEQCLVAMVFCRDLPWHSVCCSGAG